MQENDNEVEDTKVDVEVASESTLDYLNSLVAKIMVADAEESVKTKIPLPAANLSVMVNFLKLNDSKIKKGNKEAQKLREMFGEGLQDARQQRQQAILDKTKEATDDMDDILS